MGWTNAALQEMIDKFGDAIFYIGLNNGKRIYIGYPVKDSVKISDISLETIGGVDLIKIKHRSSKQSEYYEWSNYMTTEFIESVEVMDEPYTDFRVDPLILDA